MTVYFCRPNCQHLDNWRRCKVHMAPWWIRWLLPKGRPPCVLDQQRVFRLQDEEFGCADQRPYPRPAPPQSSSGARRAP
jgi:hypothetical protein